MKTSKALAAALLIAAGTAQAQTKAPQQVVKPPVAQLWVDVATHTMPGMPEMPSMPGMGALGGMLGMPGGGGNAFGNSRGMSPGRWADVALYTQRKPGGTDGTQTVPQATGLAPSLLLLPVKAERPAPRGPAGEPTDPAEFERPKGRILFYWGCSETVRPGQPRVLDFSKAGLQDWGNFMQGRAPRERGAVARPGHAIWPNEKDSRAFGRGASLAGEHEVTGEGVPAGMKFSVPPTHDFMPAIALTQTGSAEQSVRLAWQAVAPARAYFINAMGGGEAAGGGSEMVMWSSAEVPEFGMGLIDYASPANIEQWTRERVLLSPATTQCAIPAGIFAKTGGAMLRMVAYGPELNLAHPPRPTDVKVPWEPEWAVRVRTKSTAMAMLGQSPDARASARGAGGAATPAATAGREARPDCPPAGTSADAGSAIGGALGGSVGRAVGGALGGLFGKKEEKKEQPPTDCPQ